MSLKNPMANPPASHPPPPPAPDGGGGDATGEGSTDADPLLPKSYQQGGGGRAAAPPAIRNFHGNEGTGTSGVGAGADQGDVRDFFFVRGDASLRPNTGETNSYDTAVFGLALREILENIRLANIIAALVALVLLVVSWFMRLVTGQIARLVLSCYLAFLSAVLMAVEMVGMWKFLAADAWIRDNLGLVRHPVGKICYIYLLSTVCLGIGGIPEFVLGALYFVCATLLLFVWCAYPEFRRQFADSGDDDEGAAAAAAEQTRASWSEFAGSAFLKSGAAAAAGTSYIGEKAALLGSATKK